MVEAVPIVLQWPTEGAEEVTISMNCFVVDLALGEIGARLPDDGARAAALAVMPAVEHRPAGEDDRGNVDRRRGHDAGRRRLVAAGCQHHAVEEIAHQNFDQAEIGEIAVERRGRPLARLLNRVNRKFERDARRLR